QAAADFARLEFADAVDDHRATRPGRVVVSANDLQLPGTAGRRQRDDVAGPDPVGGREIVGNQGRVWLVREAVVVRKLRRGMAVALVRFVIGASIHHFQLNVGGTEGDVAKAHGGHNRSGKGLNNAIAHAVVHRHAAAARAERATRGYDQVGGNGPVGPV